MKALFMLFVVLALASETLQGADARSLLGPKERQLIDTVHKDNTATAMGATKSTSTPATITSSSTTSTVPSTKTSSSPTRSSTNSKAGSKSTADGNLHAQSNDVDFWGGPTTDQTHHVCLDYSHPNKRCV
ncbi:hypothetical protein CDL15_Pgr016617 [Punica granatum]|uniref:Uncharacterized protein n=1 Tax=Punica granatum TaxID=22663 RepID=A0A218XSX4_PUNGR|nr:hypothetical protein CDL15_Pgr016617 [Punica granatum]PKI48080.1 hypothetical protein CRG98_031524 [Punica granatum]